MLDHFLKSLVKYHLVFTLSHGFSSPSLESRAHWDNPQRHGSRSQTTEKSMTQIECLVYITTVNFYIYIFRKIVKKLWYNPHGDSPIHAQKSILAFFHQCHSQFRRLTLQGTPQSIPLNLCQPRERRSEDIT